MVASALATSNIKATARKYNIEESTIRAWVKKQKAGTGVSRDVPRKEHFQQKYSEQVLILFHHPNDIFIYLFQFKTEIVDCAKTMSRKEIQSKFNVPGPTIRFSVLVLKC